MRNTLELAKGLKEKYDISDYEALNLALKFEQNDLLIKAFVISKSNSYPSGIEAIALGFYK